MSHVLTEEECQTLRSYADNHRNATKFDDRISVAPSEFAQLLPPSRIRALHETFLDFSQGASVTHIVIRITTISPEEEGPPKHVRYHNDGSFDVMHMYLNSVGGGNLHYLTSQGHQAAAAETGHAVLHRNGIVHGVSSFEGTRYILIFMNGVEKAPKSDVLRPLYEGVVFKDEL